MVARTSETHAANAKLAIEYSGIMGLYAPCPNPPGFRFIVSSFGLLRNWGSAGFCS